MRPLMLCMLLCALLGACSEEEPGRPGGQVLIQTDPLAEVKAELARDPRNADAWLHLADLYERSGMYTEEADALTKVLSIDPKRGFAYLKLGTTYNRLGRYADAVTQFQKAKQYLPKNPVLFNNLAFSFGKINKTDEQIASLKQAIILRPSYATARYNRRGKRTRSSSTTLSRTSTRQRPPPSRKRSMRADNMEKNRIGPADAGPMTRKGTAS
jgi:Tfp pilus assembly protein PilF